MPRLLPTEAATRSADALAEFNETGRYTIQEPCDCGSQPRHTTGGNYHEKIELALDSGQLFIRYGSTCALEPEPEWQVAAESAPAIIERYADWL